MHKSVNNLIDIQNKLNISNLNNTTKKPNIIAVSKTFSSENIIPLLKHGHKNFGENKIQEAVEKWTEIKVNFQNVNLHMLGKVQTNKVKFLIPLFDYLHSLDNLKLAEKISKEEIKKNKKIKIFIQVNIGDEKQKNGVNLDQLENFYKECSLNLNLNIIGLMCLPPKNKPSQIFFSKLKSCAVKLNLNELSMGMSNDFEIAAENGSTFLRIGSKIFGERN
jgi:PLP dependent protein